MDVSPSVPVAQPRRLAELPLAKDMSHHINRLTKNRQANSLKEMYKYASLPGMVSMAGGKSERDCSTLVLDMAEM